MPWRVISRVAAKSGTPWRRFGACVRDCGDAAVGCIGDFERRTVEVADRQLALDSRVFPATAFENRGDMATFMRGDRVDTAIARARRPRPFPDWRLLSTSTPNFGRPAAWVS